MQYYLIRLAARKHHQRSISLSIQPISYSKDLTYVATGPLTNIAAALKQDPSSKEVMGGALTVYRQCGPMA